MWNKSTGDALILMELHFYIQQVEKQADI